MARYIDADALIKYIESKRLVFKDTATVATALKSQGDVIRRCIETCPTADVAPKSEVARLEQDVTRLVQENETLKDSNEHLAVMLEETKNELEAMRGAANSYKMRYENLAREIFKDIFTIIRTYEFDALVAKENYGIMQVRNFGADILKLKKKYPEERE